VRDHPHADHRASALPSFFGRLRQLDAASLSAPAGMYLRFDHDGPATQPLSNLNRLWCRERNLTGRDGHSVPCKDRFCLVFVYFHEGPNLTRRANPNRLCPMRQARLRHFATERYNLLGTRRLRILLILLS
jgi:hypothetical protein